MKKKPSFILLLLLLPFLIQAQTVLLHEKVDTTYRKTNYGVNSKHFLHSYFAFGFLFDSPQQRDVTKFGATNNFSIGLRYKLRITNFMATGVELEYRFTNISYPTKQAILKEKYHFKEIKYAWYYRINMGMRGDIMGKFIDIGVWGASLSSSNKYIKKEGNFENSKTIAYYEEDLNYINKFNYGFLLRLGINQFVIFSEYLYSVPIENTSQKDFKTIPRWTIGLQIGLHR